MKKFCLLGKTLKHSLSPLIHAKAVKGISYTLTELADAKALSDFVARGEYDGFNVTIPYKEAIIPMLAEIEEEAKEIGAVNTVVKKDGKYIGYNTDAYGMNFALSYYGVTLKDKRVMILGGGGTAKTAIYVAKRAGAKEISVVDLVGRELNFETCYQKTDVEIIIHTTPVGMHPDIDGRVVDLSRFKKLEGFFDVVYNPLETAILKQARSLNIPCGGGLLMLVAQALRADELFVGQKFTEKEVLDVYNYVLSTLKNIVLIGMPSSGKSSAAKRLEAKLHKEVVDTDAEIVKAAGKSIPQIFAEDGEKVFRDMEARQIKIAASNLGKIIATGGGAVLRKENRDALKGSFVVWLRRDLDKLKTEGRPLSKDLATLQKMWEERKPMYEEAANLTVFNNGFLADAVRKITEAYEKSIGR